MNDLHSPTSRAVRVERPAAGEARTQFGQSRGAWLHLIGALTALLGLLLVPSGPERGFPREPGSAVVEADHRPWSVDIERFGTRIASAIEGVAEEADTRRGGQERAEGRPPSTPDPAIGRCPAPRPMAVGGSLAPGELPAAQAHLRVNGSANAGGART
jgi:hypothetical protein